MISEVCTLVSILNRIDSTKIISNFAHTGLLQMVSSVERVSIPVNTNLNANSNSFDMI